jgi:hypothetical protein
MNQQLLGLRDHLGAMDGEGGDEAVEESGGDTETPDQEAEEESIGDQIDALAD